MDSASDFPSSLILSCDEVFIRPLCINIVRLRLWWTGGGLQPLIGRSVSVSLSHSCLVRNSDGAFVVEPMHMNREVSL